MNNPLLSPSSHSSSSITIPHNYLPRAYQLPFWQAMTGPAAKKRACLVWHRRSGKDTTFLNFGISQIFPANGRRVGTLLHLFPSHAQGKKVILDAIHDGKRLLDLHFPRSLVKSYNETEMKVTLNHGPI